MSDGRDDPGAGAAGRRADPIARRAAELALWHWSTGDALADCACAAGIAVAETWDLLKEKLAFGTDGRAHAGMLAAIMLTRRLPGRWIAVEHDVVAVALDADEKARGARRLLLHEEADWEADRHLRLHVLVGLSRAIAPDLDPVDHFQTGSRLAYSRDGRRLVTTRAVPGGMLASSHPMSFTDALVFVETRPVAWRVQDPSGRILDEQGSTKALRDVAALAEIEGVRGDIDPSDAERPQA